MPDVVGTTSSEATATLRDAGFEANIVAVPSDQPAGTVIAQNPAAGSEAPEGSTVRVNVAQRSWQDVASTARRPAPAATTSPDRARARDRSGCRRQRARRGGAYVRRRRAEGVRPVRPVDGAAGRVVAQAQPAGTEREPGDTVQLNVSIGPEPRSRPRAQRPGRRRPDEAGPPGARARGFEVLAIEQEGEPDGGPRGLADPARRALRSRAARSCPLRRRRSYFGRGRACSRPRSASG